MLDTLLVAAWYTRVSRVREKGKLMVGTYYRDLYSALGTVVGRFPRSVSAFVQP